MKNLLTKHPKFRLRQRGIKNEVVDILFKHGDISNARSGATKVSLTNREKNKIISEKKERYAFWKKLRAL